MVSTLDMENGVGDNSLFDFRSNHLARPAPDGVCVDDDDGFGLLSALGLNGIGSGAINQLVILFRAVGEKC
jgi:hypothetical protein